MSLTLSGLGAFLRFAWTHRKALAQAGSLQTIIDERDALRAERAGLQDEVAQLRKAADLRGTLDRGVYWTSDSRGGQHPVCPSCYGADGKIIPMTRLRGSFYCQKCRRSEVDPDAPPSPPDDPATHGDRSGWVWDF